MTESDHDRIAQEIVSNFAKEKEHFDTVRNFMGALAHAEIIGSASGRPTGTAFIKGPNDWDLQALYEAATHAHPAIRKRILAKLQKAQPQQNQQAAGRESVRDSINRAMTLKPTDKPKAESVRDSIRKAMKG